MSLKEPSKNKFYTLPIFQFILALFINLPATYFGYLYLTFAQRTLLFYFCGMFVALSFVLIFIQILAYCWTKKFHELMKFFATLAFLYIILVVIEKSPIGYMVRTIKSIIETQEAVREMRK